MNVKESDEALFKLALVVENDPALSELASDWDCVAGDGIKAVPENPKHCLAELLAATPEGAQRVDGWDELPDLGREQCGTV